MKKKSILSRLLAAAMSLTLAFTMMPIMGAPVYADDPAPAAICLANGAAPNIKGGQKDNIYFGHYPQSEAGSVEELTEDVDYIKVDDKNYLIEPIKWRALDFPVDSQGNLLPELVLLSDQILDCKQYHEQNTSITWKDSTIRAWLNDGFKNTAFLSSEQEAVNLIEVVNKANPGSLTPGGDNTEDWLFLLSIEEATNEKYGFTNDYNNTTTRGAKNTAYAKAQGASTNSAGNGFWWLRSPDVNGARAAVVLGGGNVNISGYYVYKDDGVRPAFNLNLSSVLFTSAAVGGKSSGDVGAGSLKEVGTNETNEWKLTVKDKAHEKFEVEKVTTCDGKTLTIKYSGAAADGKKEYISAIIKGKNGVLKSYGKIALASDAEDASAKVNIDGKLSAGDTLCVFNEQCNGVYETDFSSPLRDVTIPTQLHDWKDATCTDPKTCKECGVTEGAALGHKYGAWTKLDADQHQRVCEHDATHVEKENHSWDAGRVTTPPTTQTPGVKTITCTVCKATKTETIPKLNPSVSGTPLVRMTTKGDNSLVVSWNKIQGADGYDVYFAYCGETSKYAATVKGNNTFSWTKSGLKKGRCYKAYVKAYVMRNGRKTFVKCSPLVLAYASGGSGNYTSAKAVTVEKASANLTVGKAFQVKPSIEKLNKNKYLMPKKFAPTFRYMSSDEKVATVSSGGKVTAKGKGTCNIYVYAHNGVSRQVKVVVK